MNIRIKFQKYGVMKFIGHLDMMRYFQKAIRRAKIDIAYSGGYSPHQIMSFAAPLGVGITSDGEYFDIEVNSVTSSRESIDALNQAMVEGVFILEYRKLPDTAKTSMSLVAAADYLIYVKSGYESLFGSLEEFSDKISDYYEKQTQILITKQTKKSKLEMNLKNLIYEMKGIPLQNVPLKDRLIPEYGLFLKVSTGSSDNVKPELVVEDFCRFCGIDYDPLRFQVHRLEVYARSEEIPVKGEQERKDYQNYLNQLKKSFARQGKIFPEFLPLGELGEDIL
ncbi:DUF2344 domain-containing protein [Petralouisia muris]|uniref:DUF2344 domain-containing protein n=1 Tax=Petralouisia muris TaxID=3032872 RepID=A0AC61RXM1_9FIRM|nr:TIGR03936 family radical SAM-associated protein [Petralouisia muris]TGY96746.1 DUF2344 domain-containing protein [Petralouisia muris]